MTLDLIFSREDGRQVQPFEDVWGDASRVWLDVATRVSICIGPTGRFCGDFTKTRAQMDK